MKLYAPLYYKRFKCIADKCKNSCCVNWEIDIDDESYRKYTALGESFRKNLAECDGVRHIRLSDNGRCPYLNERGLCDIIIGYGEEYLTDICREHPRFYNEIENRREVGIGLVCEEAARLIITDERPFAMEYVGECEGFVESLGAVTLSERDSVINTVSVSQGTVYDVIDALEEKYSLSACIKPFSEWFDIFSTLEILDAEWEKLITEKANLPAKNSTSGFDRHLKNILSYFLFRHLSSSDSYVNFRARIAFSILSVRVIAYLAERAESADTETLISYARLYSSEIEYSEDNTAELIFELESSLI